MQKPIFETHDSKRKAQSTRFEAQSSKRKAQQAWILVHLTQQSKVVFGLLVGAPNNGLTI